MLTVSRDVLRGVSIVAVLVAGCAAPAPDGDDPGAASAADSVAADADPATVAVYAKALAGAQLRFVADAPLGVRGADAVSEAFGDQHDVLCVFRVPDASRARTIPKGDVYEVDVAGIRAGLSRTGAFRQTELAFRNVEVGSGRGGAAADFQLSCLARRGYLTPFELRDVLARSGIARLSLVVLSG